MSLGRKLKSISEAHGSDVAGLTLLEGMKSGKVSREQIHIRDLAEAFLGPQWAVHLRNLAGMKVEKQVLEAGDAVDASAFSNITGQLLINEIKDKYKSAEFVGRKLVGLEQITNGNLGTQKTPYHSEILDAPKLHEPGDFYAQSKFKEQWITYPGPQNYGQICAVTFEMIYSDLTKQVFDSARSVGRRVGLFEEEQILNVILGLVNNHNWLDTAYNTYYAASDSKNWTNKISGLTLRSWEDLNTLEQLFADMLDPVISKPIDIQPNGLLVMPFNYYNVKTMVGAKEVRKGNITSGDGVQTVSDNPLEVDYPVIKSKHAYRLLLNNNITASNAREYCFLGDFKRAFTWRQVYPLQVIEAPPQNPMQFLQNIVLAVRADIYGVAAVSDPRYVAWGYNS